MSCSHVWSWDNRRGDQIRKRAAGVTVDVAARPCPRTESLLRRNPRSIVRRSAETSRNASGTRHCPGRKLASGPPARQGGSGEFRRWPNPVRPLCSLDRGVSLRLERADCLSDSVTSLEKRIQQKSREKGEFILIRHACAGNTSQVSN